MTSVQVKDNADVVHNMATSTNADGTENQKVELAGVDNQSPLPVAFDYMISKLMAVFSKLRFSNVSDLYVNVTTIPSVTIGSGTVTTVTTGNIGIGDLGKNATSQIMTQMNFMSGVGQNFTRA